MLCLRCRSRAPPVTVKASYEFVLDLIPLKQLVCVYAQPFAFFSAQKSSSQQFGDTCEELF